MTRQDLGVDLVVGDTMETAVWLCRRHGIDPRKAIPVQSAARRLEGTRGFRVVEVARPGAARWGEFYDVARRCGVEFVELEPVA